MLRRAYLFIGFLAIGTVGAFITLPASNPLIDPFVLYQCNNKAVYRFVAQLPPPTTDSPAQCMSASNTMIKSHIVTCTVQISINSQPINVVLLSSSGAFWVASNQCSGSCPNTSTYDSSKFNDTSTSYNTNDVHGTVAVGTVNFGGPAVLGGVNALQQPFGLITSIDSPPELMVGPPFQGVFGFTYANDSFVHGLANPLVTLTQQGKLTTCAIAFAFLAKSNRPLTGYTTLNKPDPVTYLPGTFSYTSTLFPGYWLFNVDSLIVNQSTTIVTAFPALLAPFLAFIYGPSSEICQLNQKLGCSGWSQGVCFVDCTRQLTLPSMTLTIQNRNYTLTPEDYILSVSINVCLSAFLPDPLNSTTPDNRTVYWTLGNPFVAKYTSSFDCENNTIGLATKNPLFKLPV